MGVRRRVLIIDDDIDFVDMLRAALADASVDIVTCSSGEEGLEKAAELRPNLIVLDMFMAGIHGLQALAKLRTQLATAEIPVLITTSMTKGDIELDAADLGADFVPKNATVPVIAMRIKRKLGV